MDEPDEPDELEESDEPDELEEPDEPDELEESVLQPSVLQTQYCTPEAVEQVLSRYPDAERTEELVHE